MAKPDFCGECDYYESIEVQVKGKCKHSAVVRNMSHRDIVNGWPEVPYDEGGCEEGSKP